MTEKTRQYNLEGMRQFISKEPIVVEREIITLKNGRWGTRTIQEQVEFAWDESRKAVIMNPFFQAPAEKKAKGGKK